MKPKKRAFKRGDSSSVSRESETTVPKPKNPQQDSSPYVSQLPKLTSPVKIRRNYAISDKVQTIFDSATDKLCKIAMIDGLWGTAKTYVAALSALELLNNKKIDQIIYVRNPVESSTTGKTGLLPGDLHLKMEPYNAPMLDKLHELLDKNDLARLLKEGRIEFIPLGYLRGRTFNCKAVIVDEAASMTFDDLLLITSRMGEFSKLFLIGDSRNQNDIGNKTGFRDFFNLFSCEESAGNGIFTFELREESDIVRSGLLKFIMHKTGKI